jgi:sarcosine oxidase
MEARHARFDAIVVGVGGMGSAAAYHLATRGKRVLALERFHIAHDQGSSHGITRIIRLAYFEHPSYVPLLRRAYELWDELGASVGEALLCRTGSLDIGMPNQGLFEGSLQACEAHGLAHEVLNASDLHRRFPGYSLPDAALAVFQPDGGYLLAERCVVAHADRAQRAGAEIHAGERVRAWAPLGDGVRVTTDRAVYDADRLVLTAGAWMGTLVAPLAAVAVPERQVVGWFAPHDPALFSPHRFPVFNMRVDEGTFYGVPMVGLPGLKVGRWHHRREIVDPDTMSRTCDDRDEDVLRPCVERYFPKAAGPVLSLNACLFTNSPDEHFIIDLHPDYPQVSMAAGFSGHGFKFCSVVGEIMADLADTGTSRHDLGLFRLGRSGLAALPAWHH